MPQAVISSACGPAAGFRGSRASSTPAGRSEVLPGASGVVGGGVVSVGTSGSGRTGAARGAAGLRLGGAAPVRPPGVTSAAPTWVVAWAGAAAVRPWAQAKVLSGSWVRRW